MRPTGSLKCRAVLIAAVCAATAIAVAPAGASGDKAVHYYVSLGDSLAASFQPTFDDTHGYAEQLHGDLKQQDRKLRLVKLGCGGETAATFVTGLPGGCVPRFMYPRRIYPHGGTQLAEAVHFLHAHGQKVSLVTIDIGGNDVAACVAALDTGCFQSGMASVQERLPGILAALRDAAGPEVPIVGMTYYDPFSVFWFADPTAGQAADNMMETFNDTLEGLYSAAGVPVARVSEAFEVGTFPASAFNTCAWTWMCDPSLGPDIHPTTAGYGVIAEAFAEALQ